MTTDYFRLLSPFIREYIYKNNWTELREIQVEACRIIFETDAHLLLSSGTASGKTEAAFLPVLTKITKDPPMSVGVLYIAPMKALINDQFYRLDDLLKEADIPVCCWHGDILQSHKNKLIKNPSGVLQITPESLESMLINRNRDLVRLFGDLRFIIIDEVHAFMGSDRGIQLLCQLERLKKYVRTNPRRIGLSATLGDYSQAEAWLSSGTTTPVITAGSKNIHQKIKLSVEHFTMPVLETDMSPFEDPAWVYMYDKSLGKRCIIFSNGRETADCVIANLKYMAAINQMPDIYHVHHGSISSSIKEFAETEMKESEGPIVTGATVTLEMGIDIGRLERVIQIGPPVSVASLVQRLGRSGRRGNIPEMWFLDWELPQGQTPPLPNKIPWRLLQVIAMVQLYLEERWMEPPKILKYPLTMLYHQIMSGISAAGELSPQALGAHILSMSSFKYITHDDLRDLIIHLISKDHLQLTEGGGLIIGLEGEKIVNNYKFFAVFPEEDAWMVMEGPKKVGTIEDAVPPSQYITIAGKCWLVLSLDNQKKIIFVEATKRKILFYWHGDRAIVHNKILQRMKKVLFEDIEYPYLQEKARECLRDARSLASENSFDICNVFEMSNNMFCILPWMGHISYYTFTKMLRKFMRGTESKQGPALSNRFYDGGTMLRIKSIGGIRPYFITVKLAGGTAQDLLDAIKNMLTINITPETLVDCKDVRQLKKQFEYKEPKYDKFIPEHLLKQQVIEDYIDLDFIKNEIDNWQI